MSDGSTVGPWPPARCVQAVCPRVSRHDVMRFLPSWDALQKDFAGGYRPAARMRGTLCRSVIGGEWTHASCGMSDGWECVALRGAVRPVCLPG